MGEESTDRKRRYIINVAPINNTIWRESVFTREIRKFGMDCNKFLISYPSIVVAAVLTALFICSILSLSSAFPFLPDLHRSAEMAAIRVRKMKTRILKPSLKMWFMSLKLFRFLAPLLGDTVMT